MTGSQSTVDGTEQNEIPLVEKSEMKTFDRCCFFKTVMLEQLKALEEAAWSSG